MTAFALAKMGGLSHTLKACERCEDHSTDERQAFGNAIVQRVLRRVVIAPERGQVDDIDCGHALAQERPMIVFDRECAATKRPCVSQLTRALEHNIAQPRRRIRLAQDIQVTVRNQVHEDQCLDLSQPFLAGQFVGQMPAPIQAVAGRPLLEGLKESCQTSAPTADS